MISRRIIRIKVLQILYAHFSSPDRSINNTEKELFFSLQKTFDLYHLLLALPTEIVKYAESRIELRRNKQLPTEEDLNPNTKFIENKLVTALGENEALANYLRKSKISWSNDPELIQKFYLELIEQDFFITYLNNLERSMSEDRRLLEDFFQFVVLGSEDMDSHLEEQSIYWNDDLDFVVSMVIKTLKRFKEEDSCDLALMPMFKDEEDEQFAKNLFRKAVLNHADNNKIVQQHTLNWDVERIAFMDILIMEMAITEFMYFPSIPVKVSMNEYIELSKYYSTEKSRNFINGILDKTLKDLKKSDKVIKAGRGLIGEDELNK